MKPTSILATLAFLALSHPAMAQQPTENFDPLGEINNLPKLIRVQVEFIEMPHTALTKLMKEPRKSANDTDLRAACDKLIEKKEAIVLETASVIALPGQNATTESIKELIYATEYEPWELPTTVPAEGEGSGPRSMTPPTPTAFDTKNVGTTLEVEAQIDQNDKIVELRMTPTIVYFTGYESWANWDMEDTTGDLRMPTFYVLKVKTGTTLVAGQPLMVAALSPMDEEGNTDQSRKVMLFVRADILTVGK
ncbi:hypothetical protein V2O64_05730 [Verrucomicrobiaceae bacterium 227]